MFCFFFFQAEDGIRDIGVTGVQTCALPIFDALVAANAARGSLAFTSDIREAVAGGIDVLFVAVGTPSDGNGGGADLGFDRERGVWGKSVNFGGGPIF